MRLSTFTRSISSRFWFTHLTARTVLRSRRFSRLNPLPTCHGWPYTRRPVRSVRFRFDFGLRNRRSICLRYFAGGCLRVLRIRCERMFRATVHFGHRR